MKRFWMMTAFCAFLPLGQAQAQGQAQVQVPAQGQVKPPAQKAPPSPATEWYRAGHVTLNIADAARDFKAAWQFDRADNGDSRVVREESRGGKDLKGSVISICQDQALVMQGITPARGNEMRELDEPVLHLQMLLRLLARAVPAGPASLNGERSVAIEEPANVLRVRKGMSARRDFDAPWRVSGKLARNGSDISFDLVFNHAGARAQDARTELALSGTWREQSNVPGFADATKIEDATVFRVDTVAQEVGGHIEIDLVAATKPLRYATLGHLRRHIERVWSPNANVKPVMRCRA